MSPVADLGVADVEEGLKTYLRTVSVITSLVTSSAGPQIFLGLPEGGPKSWGDPEQTSLPAITIFRVTGGPEDTDYPSDKAQIQLDVWGQKGMKLACFNVAQAVVSTLRALPCGTILASDVRALGVSGINMAWLPDPQSGRSRYMVTCVVQTQAIST